MIPRVIHYCWFGNNPKPEAVEKCIASWKKYCPSYKIIEWNESNYDIKSNPYVCEAYEAKKWAFVSDFARVDIIYHNGGIYLDTDVELLKPFDPLLQEKCFFGTEPSGFVATGVGFGAEKGNETLGLLLSEYHGAHFKLGEGFYDLQPCPYRNTKPLLELGYSFSEDTVWRSSNCVVYPPEFFCPINNGTGEIRITDNTYSIHHYSALWISEEERELNRRIEEMESRNGIIKAFFIRQYLKFLFAKQNGLVTSFPQYMFRKIIQKIHYLRR